MNASRILRSAAGSLLSVVFPSVCSICHQEITEPSWTGVCLKCWEALEPWRGPVCPCCGLPRVSALAGDSEASHCAACGSQGMSFDRARSFGLYRDLLRSAVLLLKFQPRPRWGTKLGTLLAPVCEDLLASCEEGRILVIPVPLHTTRLRQRGYNQAELLALGMVRTLAKSPATARTELERAVLTKTRATPPQTGLSLAARLENVRGAFAVRRAERVRGRMIILVDDVMTTGATLSACASALKSAGAGGVLALTLARATPQFPDTRSDGDLVDIDD